MPALVFTACTTSGSGQYIFQKNPAIATDPTGFDVVTARIQWRGTQSALLSKFALGATAAATGFAAPSGSQFFCTGPQGQIEEAHGHCWCDIGWKGVVKARDAGFIGTVSPGDQVISATMATTSREIQYPLQQGDYTIIAPNPYAVTAERWGRYVGTARPDGVAGVIPQTWLPWRVKHIGRVFSMEVQGLTIVDKGTIRTGAPQITGYLPAQIALPNLAGQATNWANTPDPTITVAAGLSSGEGWVNRNYQPRGEHWMGNKLLTFWTASYTLEESYGP